MQSRNSRRDFLMRTVAAGIATALLSTTLSSPPAIAAEPIKIGFSMAMTGALAPNGKAALLAMKMWADQVNAKGGLLGRSVKIIDYDDQSNPSNVPGIYTKLIDVDKVDLLVSPYGTNLIAPAMPVVMQKRRTLMGMFGVGVNEQFKYDRYFQIMPLGPHSSETIPEAFFAVAENLTPAPKSVAIVGADAEFGKVNADSARKIAKRLKLKIVYDRSYPPTTVDFTPIVRAVQAAKPDLVFLASYPADTVGLVRSINELGFNARLIGGGPVGLQYAAIKAQLGPLMNNLLGYEFYTPASTVNFPGIEQFITEYQNRASKEGVDPLGYYVPPFIYAGMQVLEQAVTAADSVDQHKLAHVMHKRTFNTIVGDISFADNGEWKQPRVLMVQYKGIKGNDVEQFRSPGVYGVLYPQEFKTSDPVVPFR